MAAVLVAAGAVGGCTAGSATDDELMPLVPSIADSAIAVGHATGIGDYLVDADGYALYLFPPDDRKLVTCTGECLGSWPPLRLHSGRLPDVRGTARRDLLHWLPDSAGREVVTYAGWPLYRYAGDIAPGDIDGQGLNLNGDQWYLLAPDGTPIVPADQRSGNPVVAGNGASHG